jgi:crotonobetaine/carnitine-CoA ligase
VSAPHDNAAAPGLTRTLPVAAQTLPTLIERQATALERKSLIATTAGSGLTFGELRDSAATWAGMLATAGIRHGDRVAAVSGNSIALVELVAGCAWLGAVAVPLDVGIRGAGLAHALRDSGARALLLQTEHLDVLARVPPPASLEHVWLLDRARAHRAHGYLCEPLPPLDDPLPAANVRPGDPFAIFYEGAATGPARGVCSPHAQLYWWGVHDAELLELSPTDICLTALPLFRAETLASLWSVLLAGSTLICAPRFAPARYWRLAAEHAASRTYLAGAMAATLLAQPASRDDRRHGVRAALAASVGPETYDEFHARFGVELRSGYRSTELGRVTSRTGRPARADSLGRPLPEFELEIVDANDAPRPDAEPGELVVRPRQPFSVTTGYFHAPEASAAALRNLWFHTGARAVREEDGSFTLVEATSDAIQRPVVSVAGPDVERILREHPDVAEAAVFGVASPGGHDEVMAIVVLESGRDLSEPDLVEFCRPRLAPEALPRYVEITAELPASDVGGIDRLALRHRGVSRDTWDREDALSGRRRPARPLPGAR